MTLTRFSLTVFFILLTLSIGLVSVNSPLVAKAQNNVLSQNGVGVAEQETEQGQSSSQDGQVVSGDSSILSGNNLLCQNQDNSDGNGVQDLCNSVGTNNPTPPLIPNGDAVLVITSTLEARNCNWFISCPSPNGVIHIYDETANKEIASYRPDQGHNEPVSVYNAVPIGHTITIKADFVSQKSWYKPGLIFISDYSVDCQGASRDEGLPASCSFIMPAKGANVEIVFRWLCNSNSC